MERIKVLEHRVANPFKAMLTRLKLDKTTLADLSNIPEDVTGDSKFINVILPAVFKNQLLEDNAVSSIKTEEKYDIITCKRKR